MRLGAEKTRVVVGDVTVIVALPWGKMKKLLQAVAGLDEGDPATLEVVEKHVLGCIVGVEGLQAEDGSPVHSMTREVWDALPAKFIAELVRRIADAGGSMADATFRDDADGAEPAPGDGGLPGVGGGVDSGAAL